MEGKRHLYILCVLPDLSCRPVQVLPDYSVDLSIFCQTVTIANSDYCLYYVSPSWIQRLPCGGVFTLSSKFTTDIPDYRLQFLPVDSPPYVLRLYPFCDYDLKFAPWNIAIFDDCDVTLDNIFANFTRQFPIVAESFTAKFEGDKSFPSNEPIMDQRSVLKDTKVSVHVGLTEKVANKGRERVFLAKEIIESEENYVRLLQMVNASFTDRFFVQLQLKVDVYGRTFKSIGEIKPSHEKFLAALKRVGYGLEAPIGKVFLEYIPLFRVASPHVANYRTANQEIIRLIKKNDKFAEAVRDILKTVFEDKETVDGLLVSPVQRIPRYPLLLKQMIKLTPDIHWDLDNIQRAYDELSDLTKEIDSKQREQDERNFVAMVQKKIGNLACVLEPGRRGYMAMENVKVNDTFKASFFLFNDLLLIQRFLPQKVVSLSLTTTKLVHVRGKLTINNMFKIPESSTTHAFAEKFQVAKREHLRNMCTFGNALMWIPSASGAPNLKSACIAVIGGEFYLFGGKSDNGTICSDLLRCRSGVWESVKTENEPSPRYECSMVAFEEKLFVFGGRNDSVFFNDLLVFDRRSQKWARIDADGGPCPRSGHCATYRGSKLWIFGGQNASGYLNDIYTFDFRVHQWNEIKCGKQSESPAPRAYSTCFWIPDNPQPHFAIFGGLANGQALNDVWMFLEYDEEWVMKPTSNSGPSPRYGHAAIVSDHYVFVIGGRNFQEICSDAFRLDLSTSPYNWHGPLPQVDEPDEFVNGCCAPLAQYGAVLFGGKTQASPNAVYTYKIRLSYNTDSSVVGRESLGGLSGGVTMSRPIYNSKTKMVTSTIDRLDSTLDFVLTYDEDSLASVMKRQDNGIFWRLTSLLDHRGNSTISNSRNEFVLSETRFQLMDQRPKQIVRDEEIPGHAICLEEFRTHTNSKHKGRRSRSVKSHKKSTPRVKDSLIGEGLGAATRQKRTKGDQYAQIDVTAESAPKQHRKRRTQSDHIIPESPIEPSPNLIDFTLDPHNPSSAVEIIDLTMPMAASAPPQMPKTADPRASLSFAQWFSVPGASSFEDPIVAPKPLCEVERPVSTPAPVPNAGLRHTFAGCFGKDAQRDPSSFA